MMSPSAEVRLVRPTIEVLDAALAGDDTLSEVLGCEVVTGWATFREALQHTRDARLAEARNETWRTRFFVTDRPAELVGWGGFKAPPRGGTVEIGYEIAEARQGRGLATAAARAMSAEAFADRGVGTVVAQTTPRGAMRRR